MNDEKIAHYEIREKLGAGGMGAVYLAYDPKLERTVAIKVLTEDLSRDPSYRQRFLTEARSASALNHPNIVTVYEIGTDRDRDFIAMEHVAGRSLQRLVEQRDPLTAQQLLDLSIQLASGLAAAHRAGIIHRDLKPGNVIVTPEGRVKILDFGLAKRQIGPRRGSGEPASGDLAVTLAVSPTEPGMLLGTPGYMAPEKARGEADDHRSDIFSLGCILYALATGHAPFSGSSVVDVLHNVIHQEPPALDAARTDLPLALCDVINRCLAKQPRDRYATADDLEAALREIRSELTAGSLATAAHRPPASDRPRATAPQRRRALLIGLSLLGIALIAAAVYLFKPGAGVATTTVTVEDEEGQQISREIPTRDYRKRLAVFPFALASRDTQRLWLTYAASNLLLQDLLQDYYISIDLLVEHEFSEEARKSGFPGGWDAPLSLKRKVAKDSNCSHFITGRVGAAGDSVWTTVQLYVTESGRLETEIRNGGPDIFALTDATSLELRRELGVPEAHLREWPDLPVADISTDSPAALEAYGRALLAAYVDNDLVAMRRHFEEAVAEDPAYAWALWSLYFSYLFAGEGANPRIPEVLEALMTHVYRLPERLQFAVKANYFEYRGDPDKQLAVLKMWADLYPDDELAQQTLFQIHQIRGEHEEAVAALQRLLELEPENRTYLTLAADYYRDRGDLDTASDLLEELVAIAPDDPQALLTVGELRQVMGDHEQARAYLEKALVLEPKDVGLQLALAVVEFQLGRTAKSREIIETALAGPLSDLERFRARRGLVRHFEATGQLARAVEVATQALNEGEGRVPPLPLLFLRGRIAELQAKRARREEALALIADFRERLSFPLTAIADLFALDVYIELDELDPARRTADAVAASIEQMQWEHWRPIWLQGMGEISAKESTFTEALAYYDRWLALEPTDADAFLHRARCLRELERYDDALLSIERSLDQRPYDAPTLYEAALIERGMGHNDGALAHLERALEVWQEADPDYAPAREARETAAAWRPSG